LERIVKSAEELLLDLVAIPSVSSMSNRAVIDYVVSHLNTALWQIDLDTYGDKTNLIATTRAGSGPAELALVCHSDTVPYDPEWREAVQPAIRDGRLFGRGSCDVKGFLACSLAALGAADLRSLRHPLALIVTADEEIGCIGAKRLAARRAFSANYAVIGEPTGLRPVRAGKGYALGVITVRGKEAHSAFPAAGRSAIYDAARAALALERLARELEQDRDPSFDPPFTTLNLGTINGGTAKNIVPGECRLLVEWRPIPRQAPAQAADLISRELAALRESNPGFDAELKIERTDPAFAPSRTQRLSEMLCSLSNRPPATISFGSEAAHLAPLASEVVVFGPGDMTIAHRTGENVPLHELRECAAHLETVIGELCGSAGGGE
jgi:acetylornithine deacetylase